MRPWATFARIDSAVAVRTFRHPESAWGAVPGLLSVRFHRPPPPSPHTRPPRPPAPPSAASPPVLEPPAPPLPPEPKNPALPPPATGNRRATHNRVTGTAAAAIAPQQTPAPPAAAEGAIATSTDQQSRIPAAARRGPVAVSATYLGFCPTQYQLSVSSSSSSAWM